MARQRTGDRHKGTQITLWAEWRERKAWEEAAEAEGRTLSAWLRRAANRALANEQQTREVAKI